MPVVDMPLEELKAYKGCNPKPSDFDEYWERAMKEMNDTNPNEEFVKADFQFPGFECYDLYFDGVKNSRIHCKFVKPEKIEGKAPVVFKFHGYSGGIGDWSDLIKYAAFGFVICGLDARGQGGLSEDKNPVFGNTLDGQVTKGLLDDDPDNLYFRQVYLDCAEMAKIVFSLPYVDKERSAAYGGSQGGALTIACAALVPEIKLAAPCYPFLCDYKRTWDMDLDERAYRDLRSFFRHFDPRHEKIDYYFEKLGYIDLVHLADRIKAKVMMATGLLDTTCPPSTQFAMFNHIKGEKEAVIYPDFGHEGLNGHEDLTMQFILQLLK